MSLCRHSRVLEANLGERSDGEMVATDTNFSSDMFACRGRSEAMALTGETGGEVKDGCHYTEGRKASEVLRKRRIREGLRHLGDVTQQDSRESLGQKTLSDSRKLGPYNSNGSFQ